MIDSSVPFSDSDLDAASVDRLMSLAASGRVMLASFDPLVTASVWSDGDGYRVRVFDRASGSETKCPVSSRLLPVQTEYLLRCHGATLSVMQIAREADCAEAAPEMVYFIRDESGPIKIGRSSADCGARLAALQTGNPRPLTLLCVTREWTESQLHERFAHLRMRGEWFAPTEELLCFIESLSNGDG